MNLNDRLSSLYQDYKMYWDAARNAEAQGNIEAARQHYRVAAKALVSMAQIEGGETQRQRIMHAEQVLAKANSLAAAPAQPGQGKPAAPAAKAPESGKNDEDGENPWKSDGVPDTTFDDVIGMEDVKQLIRSTVIDQIKYPELYEEYGVKGGTGVLLFGLPGTGKTTVARAIAHEINAPFYLVNGSDIRNKWVGESEKRIRLLFEKARQDPVSLIFFDDFDSLGKKRSDGGDHDNKLVVEMIVQMDGFRKNTNTIVLLAATNKPWMIDSALMRPGRFEHHFYVPLANHEARMNMVTKMLGEVPVEAGLDMSRVSDLLKGYNGADIKSVVGTAKRAALQRSKEMLQRGEQGRSPVTMRDFEEAAAGHKSSVDPADIVELRKYAQERGIELPQEL